MTHKIIDYAIGCCGVALGAWLGDHWMSVLGGTLIVFRLVETFVLEPLGIQWFGILRRNKDKSQS